MRRSLASAWIAMRGSEKKKEKREKTSCRSQMPVLSLFDLDLFWPEAELRLGFTNFLAPRPTALEWIPPKKNLVRYGVWGKKSLYNAVTAAIQ